MTFGMVGHLFKKLWHDIRAVFSHVHLQSFLLAKKPARISCTYTCVLSCFVGFLFQSIWPSSYKRAYICAPKKFIHMRYKKACVYWVTESRRIRGTELYRQQKTPSCTIELKSNFSLNQAWPQPAAKAALISSKVWFLFITLTVAVVVDSPTTDLLESVDCLLRDCVRYFTNADRNNDRFS